MNKSNLYNNIDDNVDDQIFECINPSNPKSFFLFAGAGSGKTRSLVNVLTKFKTEYGKRFRLCKQRIGVITYTNAAADEIKSRLEHDSIFYVSTIHSFAWDLIKHLTTDIKYWLKINLIKEIDELNEAQSKSRDLSNKTSIDRARKIISKNNRLKYLDGIRKFIYNPNGDNITKDSLNHSEVIGITAEFIRCKDLMQSIVVSIFPIIFVDESQDTKKELIDALFKLQENKKSMFSLGLFGDMMQRIYADGKEDLGKDLPTDWLKPSKQINHRSNKRIISLVNNIRKEVDSQKQIPRVEKDDGYVRLFISKRESHKTYTEIMVAEKMTELTKDLLWNIENGDVKTLTLEHHMAANRMGFLDFFGPLYKIDKLRTGLLEGRLPVINLFTKILLPLLEAFRIKDKFAIARIVRENSPLLEKEVLLKSDEQLDNLKKANDGVNGLFTLWDINNDPTIIDVLKNIFSTKLFIIPEIINIILSRTHEEKKGIEIEVNENEEDPDEIIDAWDLALQTPFSQIEKYSAYLSENSKFGTHQGVKGLEYARVMVILDDEEARGFMFHYDKLFGSKELSSTDKKNIEEGKDTGIDRTRRLFYVACSRAKESLAIVAYTDNPNIVKDNVIKYGWFKENEIEIL